MRTFSNHSIRCKAMQNGFTLITALIFMVILTLLGLSVVSLTTNEEQMARNSRDFDIAFAAAEAALRDGELRISGAYMWPYNPVDELSFLATCAGGLCDSIGAVQTIDQLDFYSGSGIGANSIRLHDESPNVTGSPAIAGVANQPRYMIEMVCYAKTDCMTKRAFRITAQAQGRLSTTRVAIQEVYLPSQYAN